VIGKLPARLNILTLGVRDLQKVRTFYEALGWESLSEGEEFARFQTGGATLALFSLDLLAGEANTAPAPPQEGAGRFAGFTCAVLVEEEGRVDDAMGAVREAGAACSRSRWRASGAAARATSPTRRATCGSWPGCRAPPSTSGAG
jgi:catechol 2,3-dioxygenase-like lactoylglutathione lyase family enzyme